MAQPTSFGDYDCVVTNIDRKKYGKRIVPMRVFAFGLPRTGTESTTTALRMLGIHEFYHGWQSLLNNPRDNEMWNEAIEAKYEGKGQKYGREEWDKLLGHCQGVSDLPAILFAKDLIEAYPEARVILTYRKFEPWYESMSSTFAPILTHPIARGLIPITNFFRLYTRWTRPVWIKAWTIFSKGDFARYGRQVHEDHYSQIRAMVPKDRLLEYNVKDGWDPLVKFLGAEHPGVDFPNINDKEAFQTRCKAAMLKLSLRSIAEKIVLYFIVAPICGIIFWQWMYRC
ncbi:hypothetical protein HII31_11483 [Pseudocercospora fuligena]|uniref:NAD dependent epimerase/dehydratase n=1 Tax=Pseudocercospora fuligena TaxID=685502 RepID=A0A8H6VCI2_9PEZI|nr:hypothetical protein HII31_11483 [Pseudocercospora fuligena]